MVFKLFYCDDAATARHVFSEYQEAGYDTGVYDRADCATFDVFQNANNYADSRIIIKSRMAKRNIITDSVIGVIILLSLMTILLLVFLEILTLAKIL